MEYLSIIFQEIYKILFLLVPVLVSVAMIVWLDRRVWAFVQKRQGPNVVGPFGLLQSLADALKYIFKEIIIPASSNSYNDFGINFVGRYSFQRNPSSCKYKCWYFVSICSFLIRCLRNYNGGLGIKF